MQTRSFLPLTAAALLAFAACGEAPTGPPEMATLPGPSLMNLVPDDKVTVCHIAPGTGQGALIEVSADGVADHLAHGDPMGLCLVLNEVMFDPSGSDFLGEYFEIRNVSDVEIDLRSTTSIASSLKITDTSGGTPDYFKSLDNSYPLTVPAGGYAVIYDDGSSGSEVPSIYPIPPEALQAQVDDAAIGNGLNNGGDVLALRVPDAGEVIDMLAWDGSLAAGNGLSLQRCFRGRVVEAPPTPGAPNACR